MFSRRSGTQRVIAAATVLVTAGAVDCSVLAVTPTIEVDVSSVVDCSATVATPTIQAVVSPTVVDCSVEAADAAIGGTYGLVAEAKGKWLPADMVDTGGGLVQQWTNSGTGGTNYDLLTTIAAERPTLSANADRAGTGPACTLVRASATKLATVAFAIAQPNTMLWIAKRTAGGAEGMRLCDGRTGNTHGMYLTGSGLTVNDGAGTLITTAIASWPQDTWKFLTGVYNGAGVGDSAAWTDATEVTGTLAGTGCSGIVLGDFGTAGGAAFEGVAERGYFWDRVLTDAEIQLLVAEL